METFAFTQIAVDFEDPGPAPELRPQVNLSLPKPAAVGLAGSAVVLSSLAVPPVAQAAVRLGDFCDAVGEVQTALVSRNYAPGGIDNNFGIFTERAVRNFQRINNLPIDGTVGPATAAALGLPPGLYASGCIGNGGTGGGDRLAAVTADILNIRSGPSLSSPVVGELRQGVQVQVIRTVGGWSEIASAAAGETWVSSAYLTTGGGRGGGGTVIATDSGSGANVRSFPDGPRVYGLPDGAAVQLNGVTRSVGGVSWSQLRDGNWVASFVLS